MKRLVIIARSVDDAYKFCFKIGINSTDAQPVTCLDDMIHVGDEGFFVMIEPSPLDSVSILNSLRGRRFIKIEFDPFGKCDSLEQIAGQLKFELKRFLNQPITESMIRTVSDRVEKVLESCLPSQGSPDIKFRVVADRTGTLTLVQDSSSTECLVNLMRRYLNE